MLPASLLEPTQRTQAGGPISPNLLVQAEQARRVLLEDQWPHLVLERRLLEVGEPALRRDQRVVGAEEHAVAQLRVRVAHELLREVLRRPAGEVDVDLLLVQRD